LLAELGLQRADHPLHEWTDDPGGKTWRAGLTHPVLQRKLAGAGRLAFYSKPDRDLVLAALRDLLIADAERSPYGLVASEQGAESERELTTPGPQGTPGRRSVPAESAGRDVRG
jgi:hypothetical protein